MVVLALAPVIHAAYPTYFAVPRALLNVTGFIYMSFPLALSIAASIRVGHLLGAGEADKAVVAAQ